MLPHLHCIIHLNKNVRYVLLIKIIIIPVPYQINNVKYLESSFFDPHLSLRQDSDQGSVIRITL